jgi:hypothetical protein
MRSFGSGCVLLFGFGASSDSELEMTSKAGSDLSGGNVGGGVREIRSFLWIAIRSLAHIVGTLCTRGERA